MKWLKEEWFVEKLNNSRNSEHYYVADEWGFVSQEKTQSDAIAEAKGLCDNGLNAVVIHKGKIVWQA